MENAKKELVEAIKELDSIKRIREIEKIIDNDETIMQNFRELTSIQKKMVNAKYYKNNEKYLEYEKQYNLMKAEISDTVFVEEYLELLDEAYVLLKNISGTIEYEINKELE